MVLMLPIVGVFLITSWKLPRIEEAGVTPLATPVVALVN